MRLIFGFLAAITTLAIATQATAETSINGPSRIGAPLGKPFIYRIPALGDGKLEFRAEGLPRGLYLHHTGIITGTATEEGTFQVTFTAASRAGSASKTVEMVVNNEVATLALTPIMGWNPWYVWGCNIDDKKIRVAADLLVSSGLAAYGYNYINLDDCWQGERNHRGEMVPNKRFPDMKALADYVHSKGLRIGIYTGPGEQTCAGYGASKDHVEQDVMTYAKWGFDFIKYDWCKKQVPERDAYTAVYREMSEILTRSPRAMVHMICQYGIAQPWEWGAAVGGNMWRTDHDLADEWAAILRNGFGRVNIAQYQAPGHFNDLDMLMVGKANWPVRLGSYTIPSDPPRPTKLTLEEQMTHMSLWSLMASPLLFSGDLAQLDDVAVRMLTNKEVLDINQDALAAPARRILDRNGTQVIVRDLADGSKAVGMFNLNTTPQEIRIDYAALGLPVGRQLAVRNLWSHKEVISTLQHTAVKAMTGAHGVTFLRITPQ